MTDSGIELEATYTPEDAPSAQAQGFPGEYPFTRGVYPTMYRGRLWTMRQYAGFGGAKEANRRYRYLVGQGQTGLSVAFDLPTQMGYDPDHPMACGEVGKAGVSVASLADMRALFAGIDLGRISTSMTINAPAAVLLAMYVALAEARGVPWERIAGTTQNDILKEYIARKTYIFPPEFSLRLAAEVILFCTRRLPRWNPISISGYHMREAGATAVQELAYTFTNAIAYVEAVRERGGDVDRFLPRLSFFFACDNHFFEEIAKFRAARRIWARLCRERFGAKEPDSGKLRFHTQTAGSTLTAQQPLNNAVRVALQALAAVLGGTQSLHTNSYDEALALPSEGAVKLALRTQQIIAHESGVADTVDPLGGAYYVERLTDELEARAWEEIERVESLGGALKAIESGYIQREIARSAYEKQKQIESGERLVVGVNAYTEGEGRPTAAAAADVPLLKVDEAVRKYRCEEVRRLRRKRDPDRWRRALEALRRAASDEEEELMPSILEAVRAQATVGEICDALREVAGQYREPIAIAV